MRPSLLKKMHQIFLHEGFLGVCTKHHEYVRDYIVSFMLANKDKEAILVPYHPV